MERWARETEQLSGVVRFLSLRDLCCLRRASKDAAALVDGWWKHLQLHIAPETQFKGKGEDPDENCEFLLSLDWAVSRGVGIRSVYFAPLAACSIHKRVLYDRILIFVAVAGPVDHSLRALFVRLNLREAVMPWLRALSCFSGLRRLHLNVTPDISGIHLPRRHFIAALKGRRLTELSFRPACFAFSAVDMEEIPASLSFLELIYSEVCGAKNLEELQTWLASTGPRDSLTQLSLVWEGSGFGEVNSEQLPTTFPRLERLSFVRVRPWLSHDGARLHFRCLRSLSFNCLSCDRFYSLPHDGNRRNAAGANLSAFFRALSADAQGRLESLELIGQFGFCCHTDLCTLSHFVALRSLSLDLSCSVHDKPALHALSEHAIIPQLVHLERLSLTGLRRGPEELVWPQDWEDSPRSALELLCGALKALGTALPAGFRSLQLSTRKEPGQHPDALRLPTSRSHSEAELTALHQDLARYAAKLGGMGSAMSLDLSEPVAAELGLSPWPCLADFPRRPYDATFPMAFDK